MTKAQSNRLKYLLELQEVAGLDKGYRYELHELLSLQEG
jgi:hypothetical protein